jgi:hypothetical protein
MRTDHIGRPLDAYRSNRTATRGLGLLDDRLGLILDEFKTFLTSEYQNDTADLRFRWYLPLGLGKTQSPGVVLRSESDGGGQVKCHVCMTRHRRHTSVARPSLNTEQDAPPDTPWK